MLKILIVDDEEAAGSLLKLLLERYVPGEKEIRYCSNPQEALDLLPAYAPHLLMLDIEMPGMNGFDFLNRAGNFNCDVIFTTAYDKYAIKAIRFSALDYLLKPVDIVELQNAVNRHLVKREHKADGQRSVLVTNLLRNLNHKGEHFKLAVSVKEGVFLLEPKNIICIEGQNNYSKFFFFTEKPLLVSKTIREYEEILADHHFLRVHKSWLVNREYIRRVDKEGLLWLSNGRSVPVSRRKRAEMLEWLSGKD
jgi:two-component system, LytTR family, response regulator